MVEHNLEEQRCITQMLCTKPFNLIEEASLERYIYIIEAIVAFYYIREALY
jgi:hypothetical protein